MENTEAVKVEKTVEEVKNEKSTPPAAGNRNKLLLLLLLAFLGIICVLVIVIIALLVSRGSAPLINSFEDCAAAGNPIQESFPRRCRSADGRSFVEDVTVSETPTPSVTTTPTATTTASPTSTSTTVKVYFSKDPSSYDDPTIVVAVNRTTTRTDVATFAIEQLLNGPTSSEEISGLFNPIALSGASNCGGSNFTVTINSTTRKATIKFCKNIDSAGILEDARIENVIEATLNQFSTVDSVVILDKNGDCFGDNSGMNLCL